MYFVYVCILICIWLTYNTILILCVQHNDFIFVYITIPFLYNFL